MVLVLIMSVKSASKFSNRSMENECVWYDPFASITGRYVGSKEHMSELLLLPWWVTFNFPEAEYFCLNFSSSVSDWLVGPLSFKTVGWSGGVSANSSKGQPTRMTQVTLNIFLNTEFHIPISFCTLLTPSAQRRRRRLMYSGRSSYCYTWAPSFPVPTPGVTELAGDQRLIINIYPDVSLSNRLAH